MSANAGTLTLLVDSTSVSAGEKALTSFEKTGARTEKNVKSSMGQVEAAMKRMGQQSGKLDKSVLSAAKSADGLSGSVSGLGKSLTANSYGIRMVAMQLGQVTQQMASGTSAARALSIQMPDLLLGFGTFGAVAGVAAGLLGPMAARMFASADSAKAFRDSVNDLTDAVSEYRDFADMANTATADLEAKFGASAGEVSKLAEFMREFARIDAIEKLDTAVDGLTETFGGLSRTDFTTVINRPVVEILATMDKLKGELGVTEEQAKAVVLSLEALANAETPQQTVDAAVAMNEQFRQVFGSIDNIPKPLMEAAKQAGLLAFQAGEIVDPAERARIEAERQVAVAQELIDKYAGQAAMAEAVAAHGADSAEVEALKRAEALSTVDAMIEQKGLSGDVAQDVRDAALAAFDAEQNSARAADALRDAEAAAKGLASAIASAAGFSANLENGVRVLEAQVTALQSGADAAIASTIETMRIKAEQSKQAQIAAGVDRLIAEAQYSLDLDAISSQEQLLAKKKALTEATKSSASAGSKHTRQLERELDAIRESLNPITAYNAKMAKLAELRGALTNDEFAQAVRNLNVELADSLPLVGELTDTLVDGLLDGFDGTLDSMGDLFKSWLKEMIATAAKNQIIMSLNLNPMGGVGGAVSAAGAVGGAGGGGMLGNLLGLGNLGSGLMGGGGFLGGIGTGLGGVLSGGGLGSSFANLGGLLTGTSGGLGAIGAALPALGIIAGVGGLLSAGLSQKYAGTALRGTLDSEGFDGGQFDFYKGGFLRGNREEWSDAPSALSEYIDQAMTGVVGSIETYADALALSTKSALQVAGEEFTIWLSDLSDEEIIEALNSEVQAVADEMAALVLGTDAFTRSGETASEALARLGQGILAVNDAADLLGHRIWNISLASADAASELVEAFGGLEAMTAAVNTYFTTVYSEEEQLAINTRRLTDVFGDLGLAMPKSRDQYRALVESIDTTTDAGAELYATLISMAGALDAVLPSVSSLTQAIMELQGSTQSGLDLAISTAEAAARANSKAAGDWYKASDSIRAYIDKLRGSDTALTSPTQARAFNEMQFQTNLAAALAGDLDAAGNLTSNAESLRQSVNATATTRLEAALAEARILSDLNLASGVGDIEGARHDVIAGLLTDQADLMQDVSDYLAAGNALTDDMITTLETQLGALDDAIAAAELINYQYLKDRLQVTVDVLADADVPKYLRNLLTNAAEGVTGYIDFLVRSDLTPDLKWLAMVGASEHVKTIEYLAENRLGRDLTKLAVDTVSSLEKTVYLMVGSTLDHDTMRVALAGNSELSRVVNVSLDEAGSDSRAIRLALQGINDYAVAITAAFDDGVPDRLRNLILRNSGSYAAMIEADVSLLKGAKRRILLQQTGDYIAEIGATLGSDMKSWKKRLLINDITKAARKVTLSANFSDGVTKGQKALFEAITGTSKGKITLGGSFVFDPSDSFETLLGDSIETPMAAFADAAGTLTGALGDLRSAIAAETARAEKDTAISALNSYVSSLETNADGNPYLDDKILAKMASITGVDISGLTTRQAAGRLSSYSDTDLLTSYTLDNTGIKRLRAARRAAVSSLKETVADVIEFDAETGGYLSKGGKLTYPLVSRGRLDWSSGAPDAVKNASSDDLSTWRSSWWANGGLEDQLWAADRAVAAIDRQIASFDGGGWTGDWARSGGWDGKGGKLGLLHPNEKVTTSAQNNDLLTKLDELVASNAALKAELRAFKEQSRMYDREQTKAVKETASLARKADVRGVTIASDQDPIPVETV